MKLKQKYFIDSHKGITPLFIVGLMAYYNDWNNLIGFIYLALHGTYGLLWITKSYIFPDKQWEKETTPPLRRNSCWGWTFGGSPKLQYKGRERALSWN